MSGRSAGMLLIAWFETRGVAALLTSRAEPDLRTTGAEPDLVLRSALCARLEG